MLFARRRGEGALRLAMHAAVPQSFRPDLLHLLKLNFLPRELHDPAAEADVLFSPLCEEVGRGYFEFGPHVRSLLLDNLAANYAADRTPRIQRVANFLLFYVEHAERRAAGGLDRLRRDYLEVQRWVALAFLDPDDAARQLAAALKGAGATGGEFAARLRLGGLASALSSPLVKYRHVLNYAAGLQALEAGDHARAQELLSGLGDEEIEVGGIRLRPATDLLRAYSVQSPEPTPPPENVSRPEQPRAPSSRAFIFLSYHSEDASRVIDARQRLQSLGHTTWLDIADAQSGGDFQEQQQKALDEADLFIFFLSRKVSDNSERFHIECEYALRRAAEESPRNGFIIPAMLEPCEIPRALANYQAVDLSAEGGWAMLEEGIRVRLELIEQRRGDGGHEEKVRALEALAGSDEPGALETLAEAVWEEKDARVRLAAVGALNKSRNETALETLLVAAGDEDGGVRRAAAGALRQAVDGNAVLIFGFFGTDHVESREVLREELRRRGHVPLVFPFTRPPVRDEAAMMRAAAPFTRFAVADLTASPEIQLDLVHYLGTFLQQLGAPVVPITQREPSPADAAERLRLLRQQHPALLPLYSYAGPGELRESFDRIVMEPVTARPDETSAENAPAPPPYEELLATLRESEHEQSRAAAARQIGELENPSLLQHLSAALKDASPLVRTAAIRGLARVRTDYVLPDLLEATRDADAQVRHAALGTLRTFGETMVMLLGRFTPERKETLDLVRGALRSQGYFPVMFDFEKPPSLSLTEVSVTLAQHSRFLIADLTDPTNVPYELQAIVPQHRVPLQPIIHEQSRPFSFFEDIQRFPWVLPLVTYHSPEDLLANLNERVIAPAEAKLKEFRDEPPVKGEEQPAAAREGVFISYSNEDRAWLDRLKTMLAPFTRRKKISVWDDTWIKPGYDWREEIERALASAKVAVLLVSPDYLASDFIAEHELPLLLRRAAEKDGLIIIWVAVRHAAYRETPLWNYQAVNDPGRPLNSLSPAELDTELLRICATIERMAER